MIPTSTDLVCSRCGVPGEFIKTNDLVHYGKIECPQCGRWIKWVRNPETEGRTETTKCNVKYDFCRLCLRTKEKLGSSETLTAHHIIPLNKGGKDELSNLMVVCCACHKMINWLQLYTHDHMNKYFSYLQSGEKNASL